jgi:hypothetical protein
VVRDPQLFGTRNSSAAGCANISIQRDIIGESDVAADAGLIALAIDTLAVSD